jgi:hypothetical protein
MRLKNGFYRDAWNNKSKVGLACTICLGRKTLSDERYKALVIASKPGYGYFILLNGGDCYLMHEDRVEFD